MKAQTRAMFVLIGGAVIVLLCLHAALAFTSSGVPFLAPTGIAVSILVAAARISGTPMPEGVVLAEPVVYWTVFALCAALLFAGWWALARLWGSRRRVKPIDGTLARAQVRAQNEKTNRGPRPIGDIDGEPFYPTFEDSFTVLAMSGAGKTMRFVVQMVVNAVGAVVTTSTRMDVLLLTAWQRSKIGLPLVFAPEYKILRRWKWLVGWDIVAGCEAPAVAQERADALVAARPLGKGSSNASFFGESASIVLRCLLHAAAIGNVQTQKPYTMRDVVAWMRDFDDDTPYTILERSTHPLVERQWLKDLKNYCRGDAKETRNNTAQTIGIMLKSLALPEILDAVCPAEGRLMLNLDEFLASKNSLYLLSKKKGLAAPVITALAESLQSKAMDAGEEAPLDPVLTMVLDELANVCPMPSAPSLMTDGRGHGIQVAAILQGRKQAIQRFGDEGADTIIHLSSCLILFGGSRDYQLLNELSGLTDERDVERTSTTSGANGASTSTSLVKERVLTVGQLRTLDDGYAAMFYRNLPVGVIHMPAWWESDDRDDYTRSQTWVRDLLQRDVDLAA